MTLSTDMELGFMLSPVARAVNLPSAVEVRRQ